MKKFVTLFFLFTIPIVVSAAESVNTIAQVLRGFREAEVCGVDYYTVSAARDRRTALLLEVRRVVGGATECWGIRDYREFNERLGYYNACAMIFIQTECSFNQNGIPSK